MIAKLKSKGGGLLALPLLMLLAPTPALAQGFLDTMLGTMLAQTDGWMQRGVEVALLIFLSLAVIEFAWHGIQLVLKKGELSDLFGGVVLKVTALGFFYTLIVFAPQWMPLISQTFEAAGQRISGLPPNQLTPSGLIDQGIQVSTRIFEAPLERFSLMEIGRSFLTSLLAGVTGILVFVAFMVIAIQLLVVKVEMLMVISGGVVMLAMSGSRWSMSFAEKYIGYAVSVGAKLIIISILAGFGVTFGQSIVSDLGGNNDVLRTPQLFALMGTGGIFAVMSYMVPSIAGSFLSGAASMSLANTAAAGGSMAGAGASMAGRAAGLAAGAAGSALGAIAKLAAPAAAAGSIAGMAAGAAKGGSAAGSIGGAAKSAFNGGKDGGSVGGNNRPAPSGGGAGGEGASAGGSAPSMGQSAESGGGGASSGDAEASASDTGSSASAPSLAGGAGDSSSSGAPAAADTATPVSTSSGGPAGGSAATDTATPGSGGPATGGTAFPAASGTAAKPAAAQKGAAGGAAKASPAKPSQAAAKSAAPAASPAVDSSANPATGAQTSKVGAGPIAGLAAPPGMRFTNVDPDAGSRSAMQSQSAGGGDSYSSGGYSSGGSNSPMDYRDHDRAAEKDYRARASSNPFSRAMLKASDKLKGAGEDASAFARRQRRPMASDGQTGGSPSIRLGMSGD